MTTRWMRPQIVGCLALAMIALALLHGCSEEPVAVGEMDLMQDAPSQDLLPNDDVPDSLQDEAPTWPDEKPAPAATPEPTDEPIGPGDAADRPPPEEITTDADGKEGGRGESPALQSDDLDAADSNDGEDQADPTSTSQDSPAAPAAAEVNDVADGGDTETSRVEGSDAIGDDGGTDGAGNATATGGGSSPPGEAPVDDTLDDQRLRDMLAMLNSAGNGGAEEPGDSESPLPDGQPADDSADPTRGAQDPPPDDLAEPEDDGGGGTALPELPTPPPLPPAEDVSSVGGTIVPEDVESVQETITGVWQQVDDSDAADFAPGGYVASEFTFLADGTIRIRRTFDEDGDVVMTWRVSYEWNEGQTELTLGLDPDTRPTPASLRGFTISESNVEATSATQDLPLVLKCIRSDDGQIRLADKTYAAGE